MPPILSLPSLNTASSSGAELYPGLPTTNLVFHVDAGNPASYPGSGTIWTDMINNSRLDMVNTMPYSTSPPGSRTLGAFQFNGSGYFQGDQPGANLVDMGGDTTLVIWYYNQDLTERDTIFEKEGASGYTSYRLEIAVTWEPTETWSWYSRHSPNYDYASSQTHNSDKWNMIAIRMTSGRGTAARQGGDSLNGGNFTSSYTSRSNVAIAANPGPIRIGTGYAGTVETGWISQVLVYEKYLTNNEIERVYNATKIRHGIIDYYGNLPLDNVALHLDPGNPESYTGGTTINDLSPNNGSGTISGATLIDNYLYFDGVNNFMTFPSNNLSRNGSALNIWFYVTDFTTNKDVPSRVLVRGGDAYDYNRVLAVYNGGFAYEGNDNSTPVEMASQINPRYPEPDIVAGEWINLIISWSNNVATVYINGQNVRTINPVGTDFQLEQIAKGQTPANYPDYFKGRIGNFMIYNRSLSPAEAEISYNALSPRYIS